MAADRPAATGAVASAVAAPKLTRFQDWWNLPEEMRTRRYPYRFEWQVHYADPAWRVLIVSDGFVDTFVHHATASPKIHSGQRLIVEGEVIPAEGLRLDRARITVLAESDVPAPLVTDGETADIGKFNCRYAQVRGYVNRQTESDSTHLQLDMIVEGRAFTAEVLIGENHPIPQFEGALVRVTGAYSGTADPAAPQPRLEIWVPNEQQVVVEGWLSLDPRFHQPVTPIEQLEHVPAGQRVRVQGRVQSLEAGASLVVRDDTGQTTLRTAQRLPLEPGALVEAIGVPVADGPAMALREALVRPVTGDGRAATPPHALPLLRLADQVRELTRESAQTGFPVRLRGVVAWSHPLSRTVYMLDASGGLAVDLVDPAVAAPPAGTRVEIRGRSAAGEFAPIVEASAVIPGDRILMSEALPVSLEHAMTGVEEGQWVSLSGYVRAVVNQDPWTRLDLTTSAGGFSALLPPGRHADLAGTVVRVRGVCAARTGPDHQLTGIQLWVGSPDDVEILEPRPVDPFKVPRRSIASLRQFSTLNAFNHRVRVAGVVLDSTPGSHVALADETHGLLVLSEDTMPLVPGDRIEAVGFPGRQRDRVVLREAVYRKTGTGIEPAPVTVPDVEAITPELEGRLVRVEAALLDVGSRPGGARLICQSGRTVFEALLRAPVPAERSSGWRPGARTALTGLYRMQYDDHGRPRAFEVQLRSPSDVLVLHPPPWLTVERSLMLAGVLVLLVLLGMLWVNSLRHRVRHQTEQIRAQLEKAGQLEAELFRSSKLESLGVLAGGIAHDFNNLLTVVLGNVSLATMSRRLDVETLRFLRESERAAVRARELTQQLLTFSRGGAPVRTAVALPDIVREAAEFAIHGSSTRCEFVFDPGLWTADADKAQMAQVVHNLVINAAHAMPGGGVACVTLANAEIAPHQKPLLAAGRYLRMEVSDTGAGIPREHLARIFDPYFSTKQNGHGLGLATVYSIVKRHGGHVEVASTVGRGTTFTLWIPATLQPAPAAVVPATPTPSRWKGRVLVMDDEEPIRRLLGSMLGRLDCDVTAVADGAAAVREYEAARRAGQPYELVMLDLTIPAGMGGAEAMARLREIDPQIQAIVSSGYSHDPILAHCREHGFAGVVPKPYVMAELVRVINEVMAPAVAGVQVDR